MKRDVFLNHSAVITGLGTLDSTWKSILDNRSGIVKKDHFNNSLLGKTGLSLFNRDLSGFTQNFTRFLMDECLAGFPDLPEDTFIIWTGIKNNAESIENQYNKAEMPLYSSEYDLRCWLSGKLGLKKGGMEINAACASSTVGAGLAVQFIKDGKYDHILVAGADIVSRFVFFGFAALKAMSEDVCKPFDVNRKGLTLGDGAAALFFSAERQSDICLSGYCITNDANHITGPSRDGAGLEKALRGALEMSCMEPEDVQAFCAHGTGTQYNDAMELSAAKSLFGDDIPPVFGVKGAIGHTLGAAGGIEIALCGRCLSEGILPPTVGCAKPEISNVVMEKTGFQGKNILTSNSGFGGINAAVIMENMS